MYGRLANELTKQYTILTARVCSSPSAEACLRNVSSCLSMAIEASVCLLLVSKISILEKVPSIHFTLNRGETVMEVYQDRKNATGEDCLRLAHNIPRFSAFSSSQGIAGG